MSPSFYIAFYKAELGDGAALDDGISVYTTACNVVALCLFGQFKLAWKIIKRRYSHVEIWLPNEKGIFIHFYHSHPNRITGECFTSTMRDDEDGTVMRPAKGVLAKHPDRWDIMPITVSGRRYRKATTWAIHQCVKNVGYNKRTIGDFFNPFRKTYKPKEDGNNICSVAAQGFCWTVGLFKAWRIWSPIRFWAKLDKKGFTTSPLTDLLDNE